MRVPFDKVKSLRDRTGQPLQRCKEALASTGCDLDAAERWLQGGEAIPAPAARPTPAALPTPALQPEPVESARPNGFTPPSSERNSVDDGVLDGFMSFATPPSGFGAGGSSPFAGMLAAPAPAPASDGMFAGLAMGGATGSLDGARAPAHPAPALRTAAESPLPGRPHVLDSGARAQIAAAAEAEAAPAASDAAEALRALDAAR